MKSYDLRSLVNTVAITDYTMVSPSLARVIISYTGSPDKSFINNTLVKKFKGLAAPVEASFRSLDNNSAVGYVHLNREVRATNEKQIRAGYKVLSKNILMSNEDDSLWEVKKGAGSIYLARHGEEDLSSIVQSTLSHNSTAPRFGLVASVMPQPKELAAYVTNTGDMDYGFVTKVGTKKVAIVSRATGKPVIMNSDRIVASYEAEIPVSMDKKIRKKLIAETTDEAKATMEDYYRELYGYDPNYMNEVIKSIEEMSFL